MRHLFSAILLIALGTSGCALHYDLTLSNGEIIRATTKPKLNDRGYYVFKIASGQALQVNQLRVRMIEAVNKGSPPSKAFEFIR